MDQKKIGSLIKKIRIDNNLTQKEFAIKYNVSFQAVSKWERGYNLPDIYLLKQIADDFNININELLEGNIKIENNDEKTKNKKSKLIIIISSIIGLILLAFIIFKLLAPDDFKFKTLSSNCSNFNISGSIAYNSTKSFIYITNIKYCGGDDTKEYEIIECTLYESHEDIEKKISSYKYDGDKKVKLEKFLENVTFKVDGYKKTCDEHNSLYLLINATDDSKNITTYKVPLETQSICAK